MKQKDRVRIVREAGYKGYDKSLDSKCENPQKYGVRRLDEAQAAIEAVATAPEGVLTGRQGNGRETGTSPVHAFLTGCRWNAGNRYGRQLSHVDMAQCSTGLKHAYTAC